MQRPMRSTKLPQPLFVLLLLFLLASLAPAQPQHVHILDDIFDTATDSLGNFFTGSNTATAATTAVATTAVATTAVATFAITTNPASTTIPTSAVSVITLANATTPTPSSSSSLPSTTATFVPPARYAASCLAINTTLYCYGGQLPNSSLIATTNNLYSLDLSQNFSSANAPWTDRSSDGLLSSLPAVAYTAAFPSPDGVSFYVYGGGSGNGRVANDLVLYDPSARAWSNASGLLGAPGNYRREFSVVVSSTGRAWMWGGVSDVWTGDNSTLYYNTFSILDMLNRQWETPHVLNTSTPLLPRVEHTATLLSNGCMVVLGGLEAIDNNTLSGGNSTSLHGASMAYVLVFNTQSLTWTNVTAGGIVPSPKRGHSALLAGDGKSIIVFGGGDPSVDTNNSNDVYVLDTSIYMWLKPTTSGTLPTARKDHSAAFYKDQMLILFGYNNNATALNDIFMLDTLNWRWSQSFLSQGLTVSPTTSNSLSPVPTSVAIAPALVPSSSGSNLLDPIGGPAGLAGICAGGVAAIAIVAFLLVRKPWRNTTPTLIYLPNSGYVPSPDPNPTPTGTVRSTFTRAAYLLPGTVAQAESQRLRTEIRGTEDEIEVQEMQNLFYKRHAVTTSSRPPLPDFVVLEGQQAEKAQHASQEHPAFTAPPPPPLPPPHRVIDHELEHLIPVEPTQSSLLDSVVTHPPSPDPQGLRLQEGGWSKEDEDEDEEVVIGGGTRPQSSTSWWQQPRPLKRDGSKTDSKNDEERESLV